MKDPHEKYKEILKKRDDKLCENFEQWLKEIQENNVDPDYDYVYPMFKDEFWSAFYNGACANEEILKHKTDALKEVIEMYEKNDEYYLKVLRKIENALQKNQNIEGNSILDYVKKEVSELAGCIE